MRTQEVELLRHALDLRTSGSDRWAALIDLDRVPHIDDPFFFRVLKKRILHGIDDEVLKVFTLGRHRICFVGPRYDIVEIEHKIAHLSRMLIEHSKTAIESETFDLRQRLDEFVERCRRLAEQAQEANADDDEASFSSEDENLARYLTIEETLHSADLSSLVRERPIYDFSNEHEPQVVAYELVSDIENLEEMFGTSIRQNPWLFDRVTEILDKRMLFHLMRDRANTERIMSINMHVANILSEEFKDFARRSSFGWQRHFVFELPYIEAIDDPDRFRNVIERLRTYHAVAALDGVPWSSMKDITNSADTVQMIKVAWDDVLRDLTEAQESMLKEDIERVGSSRCVLYHCDDQEAAAVGLELGFRLLQGAGVDEDVEEIRREMVDRKVAQVRAMAGFEEEEEEDYRPVGGVGDWIRGLLGGGRGRRSDNDY